MNFAATETSESKPKLTEILKKMDERNESAAVDLYLRLLIGAFGLAVATAVFIFADTSEKLLCLVFILFPVFPAVFGAADDFNGAKKAILNQTAR